MFLSPFDSPTCEPDRFPYLSDDMLWTIARNELPAAVEAWMHVLLERQAFGTLSEEDHSTLTILLERDRQLMHHKAEAAMVLIERGYQLL